MSEQVATKSLAKMSMKTMGCDPTVIRDKDAPTKIDLCQIIGAVSGTGGGEDRLGNVYEYLLGEFEGTNLKTQEVYVSNKLFLPKGVFETIVTQLKLNEKSDQLTTFGYRISVKEDKSAKTTGYSYDFTLLVKPRTQDILNDLRAEIAANALAAQKPAASETIQEPAVPPTKQGPANTKHK